MLAVVIALVAFVVVQGIRKSWVPSDSNTLRLPQLSQEKVQLPQALQDRNLPLEELWEAAAGSKLSSARAHVALFKAGRWRGDAWGKGVGLTEAIKSAYERATKKSSGAADTAILVVLTQRKRVTDSTAKRHFSNVHRGVRGALVQGEGENENESDTYLLSPTQTIATNRPILDELEMQAKERDLSLSNWLSANRVYSVSGRQFYIDLTSKQPAQELLRGNQLIAPEEVTQERVKEFERLLSDWMFSNLDKNGRLTYEYFPSRGRESSKNNMIRQWMGTVALGRAAKLHPARYDKAGAEKNIRYNLAHFYKQEGELGWIEHRRTAKLGAAALAMISLVESPARTSFAQQEAGLFSLTRHLWQADGMFDCFFKPASRKKDNLHNFYPGETLLSWSMLYEREPDPELLSMSMKSFATYKKWHLENRNPAFIPWHTQAYFNLWKQTKDPQLAAWIFEMNDWLVEVMQSNSRVAYDDTLGRFYDPVGGRYGVPHASSTGVYLEGLIDAFSLARSLKDDAHVKKYREAILLGLRSSMQLQFQDDVDMFYVSNRRRLRGGMRTTTYDNRVRVDNVQHVLMGVQKIIRDFRPEDYRATRR